MTMHDDLSCHTIRQKSPIVDSVGPCVTMYAFGCTRLCGFYRHSKVKANKCKVLTKNNMGNLFPHIDVGRIDIIRIGDAFLWLQDDAVVIDCVRIILSVMCCTGTVVPY